MRVDWTLVTGPAQEPISLEDAKAQCRIDVDDEAGVLEDYVESSRQDAEEYLGRGLFTQTWKLTQDEFAEEIWLPRAAPLQSVTSVKYYDTSGVLQTLATSYYTVDTVSEPGLIRRAPLQVWPQLQIDRAAAVVITYVVGWTAVESIPPAIRNGIATLVIARDRRLTGEAWRDAWDTATSCWARHRVFWRPPAC